MALSCTVFDIFDFEKYCNIEIWSLNVIKTAYGFLLASYKNFVSKMYHFRDIHL